MATKQYMGQGLSVIHLDWMVRTDVDEPTTKAAKQIVELSAGLTPKQFTEAISIALSDVSRYSILSTQPAPM